MNSVGTPLRGALAFAFGLTAAGAAGAAELPRTIAWTAYETGSSGYAQAVAIGSALKNNRNVTLRVLPGKNDLSRLVPVRDRKADFAANGIGTYMAQEAVFEFAHTDWGPQRLRTVAMSIGDYCLVPYAAADLGIKTAYDLKGKRVSIIRGAPALNYNLYVYMRFAGLTWDDVIWIEFPGATAAADSIVNNQADAAFGSTITGNVRKLEASPRGAVFAGAPHDDEEGWKRLLEAGPYYVKHLCTEGVGLSKEAPLEAATYPYPILMTYDHMSAETAYAMTKALFEMYEHYRDAAPGADGWSLENQRLDWVVPVHEGAVRYYKEVGKWTDAHQANNESNLARQDVLVQAWEAYMGEATGRPAADIAKGWQPVRAKALEDAGQLLVWSEW
ncbi:MAG: TAXI family TRAP transporter solute-binding subunit [Alphaproteobacteria bacterium]